MQDVLGLLRYTCAFSTAGRVALILQLSYYYLLPVLALLQRRAGFAMEDCDRAFRAVGYEIEPVLNWLFANASG